MGITVNHGQCAASTQLVRFVQQFNPLDVLAGIKQQLLVNWAPAPSVSIEQIEAIQNGASSPMLPETPEQKEQRNKLAKQAIASELKLKSNIRVVIMDPKDVALKLR